MSSLAKNSAESNGQPVVSDPAPVADCIATAETAAGVPDPFDPASLRLSQDFASTIGVKKVLTTIPARKPGRQEFVRVRPGAEWRVETGLFEDKINRDIYLVDRSLWGEMMADVYPACLFVAITRQQNVFMWPCKLPGTDGRSNSWNESALAAARLAEKQWIRMSANLPGGVYDIHAAADSLAEPEWPADLVLRDYLKLCFKDRRIDSLDHPILRALRGES